MKVVAIQFGTGRFLVGLATGGQLGFAEHFANAPHDCQEERQGLGLVN